jgi:CheY-like chemotaxis protein
MSTETKSPTVYFVDDSATMREVMKIAFRRENIGVIASHDAVSALAEIEQVHPDVVITDVIMPEKDGFEVCRFIKQHPSLSKTPVVLLSGVVDKDVAEKAADVKADDLVRKPFQPQELIARVKRILAPKAVPAPVPAPKPAAPRPAGLGSIFGGKAPVAAPTAPSGDVAKLKVEVLRLESLVKRLQAELSAEREYARSLEEAVKTLQAV